MPRQRSQRIRDRERLLVKRFAEYLSVYEQQLPFSKPGQYENHKRTIERRLALESPTAALNDEDFLQDLYSTLQSWGIGSRGSILVSYTAFARELRGKEDDIADLGGLLIDAPDLDVPDVSESLWDIMASLAIVENETKLVACSKALHHLLPDLLRSNLN